MQADLLIGSWRHTRCRPQGGQNAGGTRRGQQVNLLGIAPQVGEVHPAPVVGRGRSGEMGSYKGGRHEDGVKIVLGRFADGWIPGGDPDCPALGWGPWGFCPPAPPLSPPAATPASTPAATD